MPVHINELELTVDVVDPAALLSPVVLDQIVAAVLARQAAQQRAERSRATELDLQSVVERQRAGSGG